MSKPKDVLSTLKAQHPRLIVSSEKLMEIKQLIRSNPLAAQLYGNVKAEAEQTLKAAPSKYQKKDNKLLDVSRAVLSRVRTLAFLFMMEGRRDCAQRAWLELETAGRFPDWNPSHPLDMAEMTCAFAIGYDWLYDQWTEEQRRFLRKAMQTKGLELGLKAYRGGDDWPRGTSNWNQVCNGGLGMGALAIAGEEPQQASAILAEAIKSLPLAMGYYAPDGAGTEGLTYWNYGMGYNLFFLSALQTALGTDFGLSDIKGFGLSGDYQLYMSGTDRMTFDFADCNLQSASTAHHFWLARRYQCPQYSWFRLSMLQTSKPGGVMDLLWFDDSGKDFDPATLPLDKHFRKAECASMRSGWTDPNAMVIGIQAGRNEPNGHRHCDLGSFILEANGERWIMDTGKEQETYRTKQNHRQRYDFYRARAEGHNTLVINPGQGPDQVVPCFAPITRFESRPDGAVAVVDLTKAYAAASRAQRTFTFADRSRLAVTDELETKAPAKAWWFFHTPAQITLDADKRGATLQRADKRLRVELKGSQPAAFSIMAAKPLPTSPNPQKQAPNECRKLAVHLTGVTKATVTVTFARVK